MANPFTLKKAGGGSAVKGDAGDALKGTAAAAAATFVLERVERHYPRGHLRGVMRGAIHFSLPKRRLLGGLAQFGGMQPRVSRRKQRQPV